MSSPAPEDRGRFENGSPHRARIVAGVALTVALSAAGCAGAVTPPAQGTGVALASASPGPSSPRPSVAAASPGSSTSAAMVVPAPAACPPPPGIPGPDATRVPVPAAPAAVVLATVPTAGGPVGALAEDGSVWIGDHRDVAVFRIDPRTAHATRIDADPDHAADRGGPLVPGIGGPWYGPFTAEGGVRHWTHIDATANAPSTPAGLQEGLAGIGLSGATGIAETSDGVWGAASNLGRIDVVELDRHDGHELRRAAVAGPTTPGQAPRLLVAAFGALWETADGETVLVKIDPNRGTVLGSVALPVAPVSITVGPKALYVAGADASVARVDPTSGCVTAVQFLGGAATDPMTGDGDFINTAAGATALYAAFDRGALAVLDPTTLAVRSSFRVDSQDYQGGLASTGATVWYPTFGNDSVLEIRP